MRGPAFEPLQINQLTLRNRVVRAAHGVLLPWSDTGGDHVAYHVARAKGGAAMSVMGIGGVHPSNPAAIPTHTDAVVPGFRAISDAVHEHGMKLVCQIWHGGAARANSLGGPPWSSSTVPNPIIGIVPVAMTKAMIDDMVECFAKAAGRVKAGGLDGVEIHAANGYLLNQFLSSAWNHREDEYGGSPENRMRFVVEVLDAVRAEVGPDFVIGLRLTGKEFVEDGLEPEETAQIARALEHKIDYLNVSMGSYVRLDMIIGGPDQPMGYQVDTNSVVSSAVSVPTMVSGRIMTMDLANHIVGSGAADMVSMVRGMIAEPAIVRKSAEDRTEQIRPCIGAIHCVGSTMTGTFACAVNPSAGHENERPDLEGVAPVAQPRRVLVAGGGPGGMEAARSAALRGHEVVLYELRRELGGQVNITARAPYRADYTAITRWQADELQRIGVKVVLNHAVDPDVVAQVDPDVLVLATGSSPNAEGYQLARAATPLPGFHQPHVYSSWDLFGFGRPVEPGVRALVFDDTGEYEPLAVADELQRRGVAVTYVTGFDAMGERLLVRNYTTAPTLRRLSAGGIDLITRAHLVRVEQDHVVVSAGGTDRTVPVDSVFFVGVNSPNRELGDYLEDFRGEVRTVGDAAGFHTLAKAIHDGDTVGRAV